MIKVLGAGLAGLTAAINLAKSGYPVEMFELRKDCGARFLGDLQGFENWSSKKDVLKDLKSMNLKLNFNHKSIKKIFLSNGTEKNKFAFKRPLFYLVERGVMPDSIDQGLKRQVIELGVKIHFNSKLNEKDADIIATGPPHILKFPGIDKGVSFETDMDDVAIGMINNSTAYKGYSYLLVSNGYGCMCTVVVEKINLANKCLEETKTAFSKIVDLKMKNQKIVGGHGHFDYKPTLVKNGKIYVGEAAGLQDALFGFGMRYAITSGYLAAKSIIEGIDYKKTAEDRFLNQLKASMVNRLLFESFFIKNYSFIVNKLEKSKDPFKFLFKLYNFSFNFQKLLFPIAFVIHKRKYKFN